MITMVGEAIGRIEGRGQPLQNNVWSRPRLCLEADC